MGIQLPAKGSVIFRFSKIHATKVKMVGHHFLNSVKGTRFYLLKRNMLVYFTRINGAVFAKRMIMRIAQYKKLNC